jgi:hypothetical protein
MSTYHHTCSVLKRDFVRDWEYMLVVRANCSAVASLTQCSIGVAAILGEALGGESHIFEEELT